MVLVTEKKEFSVTRRPANGIHRTNRDRRRTARALTVPADLLKATRAYAAEAKAEGTRRAYRSAWQSFEAWCETHGLASMPAAPETAALFLTDRANQGMTVSTIEKQLAAISEAHKTAEFDSPRRSAGVSAVLQGIRRSIGVAPAGQSPIGIAELRSAIEVLPPGLLGKRDGALLTLGLAGAFRRSDLIGRPAHGQFG